MDGIDWIIIPLFCISTLAYSFFSIKHYIIVRKTGEDTYVGRQHFEMFFRFEKGDHVKKNANTYLFNGILFFILGILLLGIFILLYL